MIAFVEKSQSADPEDKNGKSPDRLISVRGFFLLGRKGYTKILQVPILLEMQGLKPAAV